MSYLQQPLKVIPNLPEEVPVHHDGGLEGVTEGLIPHVPHLLAPPLMKHQHGATLSQPWTLCT
jgi:hypothetical protein